jgi:hypothetical protein
MADFLQTRLAPSPDAVESRVGDETVLLHLKSGVYFGLDAMGTRIWTLLKEGLAPAEICARIADDHDVALDTVEADTRRFLGELKDNAIIFEADADASG